MPEIEWVINAALRVYKPCDIGFSIVYGKKNASYIEERYSKWQNIILVNTGNENLDRGSYSGLLKMYNFYKPYENWSHILIYQTDALLIQKINDVYFQYNPSKKNKKNFSKKTNKESPFNILKNLNLN